MLTEDRPPPRPADVLADPELFPLYGVIQRSFAWTCGALAARGWLDWLRDLPLELRLALPDGTGVLGVHASPGRDDGHAITPQRDEEELRRDLEGSEAHLVFAGHTHQPTDRVVGDVRAVNLGSVSNPVTDDLRASYFVLKKWVQVLPMGLATGRSRVRRVRLGALVGMLAAMIVLSRWGVSGLGRRS